MSDLQAIEKAKRLANMAKNPKTNLSPKQEDAIHHMIRLIEKAPTYEGLIKLCEAFARDFESVIEKGTA